MKTTPISLIKSFILSPAYIRLYPLSQKEGMAEKINTYDYNLNDEFVKDINTLYSYLLSDLAATQIDKDIYDRSLNSYYKVRKIRYKDKETKKKQVERVQVEKRGAFNEYNRKNYSQKLDVSSAKASRIELLTDKLIDGTLTDDDLPKLDKVLRKNRFRTSVYVAAIVVVAVVIAAILLFAK